MLSNKTVYVEDDFLIVKVSLDDLIKGLSDHENNYIISDKNKFKKWLSENCVELGYNEDSGNSIWEEAFDLIGDEAYESGCDFIEVGDE